MARPTTTTRDEILAAARTQAQSRGYHGLNFRDLADSVGIRAASIYHHFPSKAELGMAVARRYWEDSEVALDRLSAEAASPVEALAQFPSMFRHALENGNRMCISSYMAAEHDDLPGAVEHEVHRFVEVHVRWLAARLVEADVVGAEGSDSRARAIFAAVAGAQLLARSRADVAVFDALIHAYRTTGLLPA